MGDAAKALETVRAFIQCSYRNENHTDGVDRMVREAFQTIEAFVKGQPPAVSCSPEGWKLVPVEPTFVMVQAIQQFIKRGSYLDHPDVRDYFGIANGDSEADWNMDYFKALYKAMLSTAQPAPSGTGAATLVLTPNASKDGNT